jgi:hypothetical protein
VIWWEERFLAVEDGGIGVGGEVDAFDGARGQLDADGFVEIRVGVGEEVRVIEERDGEVGVGEFDDVVGGREAESVPESGDERGDGGIDGRFRRQVEVAGTGEDLAERERCDGRLEILSVHGWGASRGGRQPQVGNPGAEGRVVAPSFSSRISA